MADSDLAAVVGVAVLGNHLLRLLFDDGTVGDVDFSHDVWKGVLEPLRDPVYFANVCALTPRPARSHGRMGKTLLRSPCTRELGLAH